MTFKFVALSSEADMMVNLMNLIDQQISRVLKCKNERGDIEFCSDDDLDCDEIFVFANSFNTKNLNSEIFDLLLLINFIKSHTRASLTISKKNG